MHGRNNGKLPQELPAMPKQLNLFDYDPCVRETPTVPLAQRHVLENRGIHIKTDKDTKEI
jgi:hypothetical protein